MPVSAVANAVGLAGTAAVLAAYLLLQMGRVRRTAWSFLLLNAFGAAGILCSLAFHFNLPAAMIEASWLAISLYGIVRQLARAGSAA